jgi:molecular chaperone GrpE (heat shock protein)
VPTRWRPADRALVDEAMAAVPADAAEPGTVVRELRRGWRFGDELLRPAQMAMAAPGEDSDPWQ